MYYIANTIAQYNTKYIVYVDHWIKVASYSAIAARRTRKITPLAPGHARAQFLVQLTVRLVMPMEKRN